MNRPYLSTPFEELAGSFLGSLRKLQVLGEIREELTYRSTDHANRLIRGIGAVVDGRIPSPRKHRGQAGRTISGSCCKNGRRLPGCLTDTFHGEIVLAFPSWEVQLSRTSLWLVFSRPDRIERYSGQRFNESLRRRSRFVETLADVK